MLIVFNMQVSNYDKRYFFFQAEDGIRDGRVTGVQTCALPIWQHRNRRHAQHPGGRRRAERITSEFDAARSEERRVGKECRSRWSPQHERKKVPNVYKHSKMTDLKLEWPTQTGNYAYV